MSDNAPNASASLGITPNTTTAENTSPETIEPAQVSNRESGPGSSSRTLQGLNRNAAEPVRQSRINRHKPESSKAAKKPIVTVSSALKKTTYKDDKDTTPKTLDYIKVQRAVLKYLETKPADGLTAAQARTWTKQIDPECMVPTAKDALRLCYYMRSQGFDVFSKIEGTLVLLFIVNQRSNLRGDGHDICYWRQNFNTNRVEPEPEPETEAPMAMASGLSDILYNLAYAPGESVAESDDTVAEPEAPTGVVVGVLAEVDEAIEVAENHLEEIAEDLDSREEYVTNSSLLDALVRYRLTENQ